MQEIANTLLVSCIPAVITGIITYMTASRKTKADIDKLQESNKHDIEKLMKQHEVDIESLKEKQQLEHKNALESNEKQQSNAAMYGVMSDIITNPKKLQGLLELTNNPAFKK